MNDSSAAPRRTISAAIILSVALILPQIISLARANQQSTAASDQLSSNQISNSLGTSEYQALVADGLLGLAGGQSVGGGYSSKRARKMSAFMPMRGRKDGRDDALLGQAEVLGAREQLGQLAGSFAPAALLMRDSGDGEASVLRLMASGGGVAMPERVRYVGTPRQFASQFAVQHRNQQQFQPISRSAYEGEPTEQQPEGGAMEAAAPLMQAKLRRAFFPMRGKKSSFEQATGGESADYGMGF